MGIVFRQSIKTSIVIFTGAILGALVTWLSTKYIIDKQQFGYIQNLTKQAIVLTNFLLLGLTATLSVYIHRYAADENKRKALLGFCLLFPLATMVIFIIVYVLLKPWILSHFQFVDQPLVNKYFMLLPLYAILFIYMSVLEQYLGSQMKVAIAAFMREVGVRVLNIAAIILFGLGYISFTALIASTVAMYLLPVVIFFIMSARTAAFGLSFRFSIFTKREYKEIALFSWYHFLLIIAITLMANMDILSLPFYNKSGLSSVAVYGVAIFLVSFLQMPAKAMLAATFTVLTKAITDNNLLKAKDIFQRSSINILIATVAMALLICCNLTNAVLIIKNGYQDIVPLFLILSIGRLADLATGINDSVLSITNHYKFNFYLSIIMSIVLYLLIRLLVPIYGIFGAAWSTSITLLLFNFVKFFFIWKKLGMQPFSKNTLLVFIAAIPALAAGFFFPHFFDPAHHVYVHTFFDTTMRSAVIIIVYLMMLLRLKPSKDLEEYLASIKQNKRLF